MHVVAKYKQDCLFVKHAKFLAFIVSDGHKDGGPVQEK